MTKLKDHISLEAKFKVMEGLKRLVGNKPFDDLLEKRAVLFQWRRTTPHNFWIAPLNDPLDYEYHSDEDGRPSILAFEVVRNSEELVTRSLSSAETGSPQETIYELRQDFIDAYNKAKME